MDGKLFDTVDEIGSTKDKAVIVAKLHILETLMCEFLGVNQEDLQEVDVFSFVKENVKEDITEEEIKFCESILEGLILNVDNNTKLLDKHNKPSMIALVAYSCEEDIDLDTWIVDYFNQHNKFLRNQKENFTYMIKNLNEYFDTEGRKSA